MPDRLQEHPATVLVVTNLKYREAPTLRPDNPAAASAMVWHEVALEGSTAGEFEEQIAALEPFLRQHWQANISSTTGNPLYQTPVVLVIHRRDHRFMLQPILPRRGLARADMDFVLLSQPYRARAPLRFKTQSVVTPLVRSLRANGKVMVVHSHGDDPGLEIIRRIWPDEDPFLVGRYEMLAAIRDELGSAARDYDFGQGDPADGLFRYAIRTLPTEIDAALPMGSSTLVAAWNAATYVAQIQEDRLAEAMTNDHYLAATRDVLLRHGGLWFNDEVFTIARRPTLS